MQQNQPSRNNPWGFQARNWSQSITRGPPPQQMQQNINRFGSPPPGPRIMRPDLQAQQFGHNSRPQNPGASFCQPRLPINPGMPCNGPQNQGPRQQWHQGPKSNQNAFFNGPCIVGQRHNGPPRPNNNPGQIYNRPPNRQVAGQPPNFFRAPGSFQQRPRFQPGKQHGEKKKKVNKRDLPENNKYYCDVCDRGYKDEDKYKLHCDQHEKCPKEGCSYIAAGKLVQLHIKLQHNSGMAKKIWSLESMEDIQRWIEERKKNFPTAANIEKKKAILAERIARGEVIEEKYFGKMHRREDNKRRGRDRGRGKGRGHGGRQGDCTQEIMKRKHDDSEMSECSAEKHSKADNDEQSLRQEAAESLGMFFAADDSSSDSSDTDDDDSNKNKATQPTGSTISTVPNVKAAGALGNLISSYIESDESDEEEGSKNINRNEVQKTDNDKSTGNEGQNNNNNSDNKKKPQRQRNRGRQKRNKDKWNPPPKVDKSLLEKLLAKEIRQERNQILQCVHYIVKNNFFEKSGAENKS